MVRSPLILWRWWRHPLLNLRHNKEVFPVHRWIRLDGTALGSNAVPVAQVCNAPKKSANAPWRRIFSPSVCRQNKKQLRLNYLLTYNHGRCSYYFHFQHWGNWISQCNVRNSVTVTVFVKHLGDVYYSKYISMMLCSCSGCHQDQTCCQSRWTVIGASVV